MEENNYSAPNSEYTNPYDNAQNGYQNNYQDNYQQYANYGNAMVDDQGRPLKNRFALKLVLSIIMILCCCVSPYGMIFAIVGLVFTCMANSAYNAGNPYDFRANARVSTIMLWIAGVLMAISILISLAFGAIVDSFMSEFEDAYDEIYNEMYNDMYDDMYGDWY